MELFDSKKRNLVTITILVASITVSGLLFVPFLQVQQLIITRIQGVNDNNYNSSYYYHVAFAYHGKEISEKLGYAHFLPLGSGNNTGNNNQTSQQLNQVKVIVNYTVMDPSIINRNMNTIMHVYTSNGTLIKRSSFGDGFVVNATTGQSQLATSITDSRVRDVRAFVFFTNAERNQNFSSPLNVNLTLGQRIP